MAYSFVVCLIFLFWRCFRLRKAFWILGANNLSSTANVNITYFKMADLSYVILILFRRRPPPCRRFAYVYLRNCNDYMYNAGEWENFVYVLSLIKYCDIIFATKLSPVRRIHHEFGSHTPQSAPALQPSAFDPGTFCTICSNYRPPPRGVSED